VFIVVDGKEEGSNGKLLIREFRSRKPPSLERDGVGESPAFFAHTIFGT
jgi:hypothetical protein